MQCFKKAKGRHRLAQLCWDYEYDLLTKAMKKFNGQGRAIAKYFGMTTNTLYNRFQVHGINLTQWRIAWRAKGPRVINGKLVIPVGAKRRNYVPRTDYTKVTR